MDWRSLYSAAIDAGELGNLFGDHTFEICQAETKCFQHAIRFAPGSVKSIQHRHTRAKMLTTFTPKVRSTRQLVIGVVARSNSQRRDLKEQFACGTHRFTYGGVADFRGIKVNG